MCVCVYHAQRERDSCWQQLSHVGGWRSACVHVSVFPCVCVCTCKCVGRAAGSSFTGKKKKKKTKSRARENAIKYVGGNFSFQVNLS